MEKIDLKGITLNDLEDFGETNGEPRFRAAQIFSWLYNKRIDSRADHLEDMANLSHDCIRKLAPVTECAKLLLAEIKGSRYVFKTEDNGSLYAVVKKKRLVLATQVGCSCQCQFCPVTRAKFKRNLTAGEIIEQVLQVQKKGIKLEQIDFGGMGEPLANYDAVITAINIITEKKGLNFHPGRVRLYTCGLVPEIKKLTDSKRAVNLVVGLHSVDDNIRSELMSVNSDYRVDELLQAAGEYGHKTGINVELEYIMLQGLNDSYADIKLLTEKLPRLPVTLMLVTYEKVPQRGFLPVSFDRQEKFLNSVRSGNVKAEIKR